MTEITRVPLQPIAKGSLGKIWGGVVAAVVLAGGIAWAALPPMVKVDTVRAGTGANPEVNSVPIVNYVGKLKDGKEFDRGQQVPMPMWGVVPGFRDGLIQMKKGGTYKLTIPAAKAYGAEPQTNPMTGEVVIPANSDLIFDIEVLEIATKAEFERYQQIQQMMRMQQAQGKRGGAPHGGPEAPMPEAPPPAPGQ